MLRDVTSCTNKSELLLRFQQALEDGYEGCFGLVCDELGEAKSLVAQAGVDVCSTIFVSAAELTNGTFVADVSAVIPFSLNAVAGNHRAALRDFCTELNYQLRASDLRLCFDRYERPIIVMSPISPQDACEAIDWMVDAAQTFAPRILQHALGNGNARYAAVDAALEWMSEREGLSRPKRIKRHVCFQGVESAKATAKEGKDEESC